MNTINNSTSAQAELMLNNKGSRNMNCEYRRDPIDNTLYQLPFFGNRCEPKSPQEGLQAIVEQFTNLLSNVFAALDNTIQGLLGLINNPAQETPPTTPAPTTPSTPAPPATTAPEAPKSDAPTAPPESTTKEKKEAEALGNTGEFLWKPVSDKDGKLAVVLPGKLTGKIKNVKIVDADGKVLDKGKYSGTGNPLKNGDREHYRFDKAGGKYPDGSFVEITMNNGNVKRVKIKETSERFTK